MPPIRSPTSGRRTLDRSAVTSCRASWRERFRSTSTNRSGSCFGPLSQIRRRIALTSRQSGNPSKRSRLWQLRTHMDRGTQIRLQPDAIPHPGEMVQEYLELNGWSQRDLARRTDLAPKTISEICNGKAPITPPTALAFERVFRRPAHLWLNFQRRYDEAQARARESERFFEWSDWLKKFPLKEMRERNFAIPEGASDMDAVLNFFGVSSLESWRTVWNAYSVAYRQTHAFKVREESVAAWVREVEIQARAFPLRNYDEHLFVASLPKLKNLSRRRVDEAMMGAVQETCANFGVAVVIVPELPNTGISGCARWLTDTKALVGLTLRYKTDDQL